MSNRIGSFHCASDSVFAGAEHELRCSTESAKARNARLQGLGPDFCPAAQINRCARYAGTSY